MEKNINTINIHNICIAAGEDKKSGNIGFHTSFNVSSRNANIKTVIADSDKGSLGFLDEAFDERSNEKMEIENNPIFDIKSKFIFNIYNFI